MTARSPAGTICTFYSYKGGVGRTFALANIAALLALWGNRVLCVDWDLEAPGLHLYFQDRLQGEARAGVVEFIAALARGETPDLARHVAGVELPGAQGQLDMMPAGRDNEGYVERMQALDWPRLYEEAGLGIKLEGLRSSWKEAYDFVLLDSRTGISDIGGICTIQLPDVLAFCFTPNHQSLDGVLEVLKRAEEQRAQLPFERGRIPALPVITRFEATIEVDLARKWMSIFEERLAGTVTQWSHRDVALPDLLPHLRVPHVSHWSFGERLPVVDEGTSDPLGIGFAFETLAAVITTRLEGTDLLVANRQSYVDTAVSRARSRNGVVDEFEFDLFLSHPVIEAAFVHDLAGELGGLGVRLVMEAGTVRGAARSRNMAFVVGDEPVAWTEQEVRQFVLARVSGDAPRLLIPIVRGDPANIPSVAQGAVWVDASKQPVTRVAAEVARAVFEQLFETRRRALGDDHPTTVAAMSRLVPALVQTGELYRARGLQIDLVAGARRVGEPATIEALGGLATIEERLGSIAEAVELRREQVNLLSANAPSHPATLDASVKLALLLRSLSRLDEAELLLRGVASADADGPARWEASSALATVLADRGVFDEALALHERSFTALQEESGPAHPQTLAALGAYGETLARAGRLESAKSIQDQVLQVRRDELGEQHPETLLAKSALADTLDQQGDVRATLRLREEVLRANEATPGRARPETLAAAQALGRTLAREGQLERAAEIQRRSLDTALLELGDAHPSTYRALDDLGLTLMLMDRYAEAEELLRRGVDLALQRYGVDHSDTLTSLTRLAVALWHRGDLDQARQLEEQVLDVRVRLLGESHPETLTAMGNLAATIDAQGDFEQARVLSERVLEGWRHTLGGDHPTTLRAMHNLASTLGNLGELDDAETLMRDVVERRGRHHGPDDADTLGGMRKLGEILAREDRLQEALELLAAAHEGLRRVRGGDHRETLGSQQQLALVLWQLGRAEDGRSMLEEAVRGLQNTLGPDHLDTLDAMWNLGRRLAADGWAEESRPLMERVVEGRRIRLGDTHSATVAAMSALVDILERLGDHFAARPLQRRINKATGWSSLENSSQKASDSHSSTSSPITSRRSDSWTA